MSFPFDPNVPAAELPALWKPDVTPGVVGLQPSPEPVPVDTPLDRLLAGPVLAHHKDATGLHLVIEDPGGRLRLWVTGSPVLSGTVILLVPDCSYPLRLALAERVARVMHGGGTKLPVPTFHPTHFQRRRLTTLLTLLDLLADGMSTHELSDAAVYPNHQFRGAAWRGANERRHVQRLRDEAVHLATSGFRDLLQGK